MANIVASVSSAIGIVKQLRELANSIKNAEVKLALADLTLELAKVRTELAELLDENSSLNQQIKDMQTETPPLKMRDGLYFDSEGKTDHFAPDVSTRRERPFT